MKKLLLFILLFCSYFCHAQNYQCLQSGVKHFFTNSQGYLRGIRIDSVRTVGDTVVYYPFHTPRGSYGGAVTLDSTGGSWLGKKVLQLSDGTFIFDDNWHDSVIIKTQASVGDSWVFYRDTSSLYYKATVSAIDTMTFAGSFDSVKTITINAYNGSGIVTTDSINGFQIILSKSRGFVSVFDLYTFPYHLPGTIYINGLDYYLDNVIGYPSITVITQSNSVFNLVAVVNPTFQQLYQWNIGDVYEYASCNGFDNCSLPDNYYLDTITNKIVSTNYTQYDYTGLVAGLSGSYSYNVSAYSGTSTDSNTYLLDTFKMPEEYNYIMPKGGYPYGTNRACFFYYFPSDTSYCMVSPAYEFVLNQIAGNQYNPPFEGPYTTITNKIGVGLTDYFSESVESGILITEQLLIFYSRSGQSCDNYHPLALTSVPNITKQNSITIFPNPATTQLTIQSGNEPINEVIITNIIGQVVYSLQSAGGSLHGSTSLTMTVNVSGFPGGVYFVRVNGVVKKFVKE